MSSSSSSSSSSTSMTSTTTTTASFTSITAAATAATTVVAALTIGRWIKRRYFSPDITCALSCQCGKIQGSVTAKYEDSIQINCYCNDCRQYCKTIASLKKNKNNNNHNNNNETDSTVHNDDDDDDDDDKDTSVTPFSSYSGARVSHIVQVCKSAITLTQGENLLGLARKGTAEQSQHSKQLYMYRYYAKCCHVPLFNTVDFLGFVGIFRNRLSPNVTEFAGPVRMFPEEALDPPSELSLSSLSSSNKKEQDVFVPDFLWKLIRYHPWSKVGPFRYNVTPDVYWGVIPSSSSTE